MRENSYRRVRAVAVAQSQRRIRYLAPLDGLRGVSVAAVLLYHANVSWARGGYLGVEVFFVLSGYLITSLLLAEHEATGRVGLGAFWKRRARRILPELVTVIVAGLVVAVVFLPDEVARLRADATSALGFAMNWRLILSHQSYFESFARPSLFQHLWSLAVEEQFYLIWPPLFALVAGKTHRRRIALLAGAIAVASAILAAVLFDPEADPSRLYYGTDTRISGILTGAALAALWSAQGGRAAAGWRGRIAAAVGWIALGQLLLVFVVLRDSSPFLYRGGFVAVDFATAALIVTTLERPQWLPARMLGSAVMRWAGTRSYGIYLWHWPVFMLTRPDEDIALDGLPLMALRLAFTLALAEASYRWVLTPVRSGAFLRRARALQASGRTGAWALRGSAVAGALAGGALVLVVGMASPARPPSYLAQASFHGVLRPSEAGASGPASRIPGTMVAVPDTGSETAEPSEPTVTPSPETPSGDATTSDRSPADTGGQPPPASSSLPPAHFAADIFAVGDSVMLGARFEMGRAGWVEMDAAVGRQPSSLPAILRDRRSWGPMPPVVVIHLGNNGSFSRRSLDQAMDALGDQPQVILVTVRVDRSWEDDNNAMIWAAAGAHSNLTVVDWYGASDGHSEYFYSDHTHLTPEGANAYARLIAAAIHPPPPTATPTPDPTSTPTPAPSPMPTSTSATPSPQSSATSSPGTSTPPTGTPLPASSTPAPDTATPSPSATPSPGSVTPTATSAATGTSTSTASPGSSASPSPTP